MQSEGFRAHLSQASIDYHLEMARRCLASSASQRSSLFSDDSLHPIHDEQLVAPQTQHGSRIAAKIKHLRNLIATLTPVPATAEADQHSVFDRFLASVEVFWGDRREYGRSIHNRLDAQSRLVQQVRTDPPMSTSRHSLEISSTSTPRHRRVGSSRI